MQLSHSFTALMAFVVITATYPAPHLLTTSLARRGVLTSNLDQNTRVVGSPSPLTPLMMPNADSDSPEDSPDGFDKRAELDQLNVPVVIPVVVPVNDPVVPLNVNVPVHVPVVFPVNDPVGAPGAPDSPNTPTYQARGA
ncbi:uncharacterized protein F5147DRAFT_724069 [Suillus discolor]|uniref:Uncharacterized protein n=1 Tax=Suillus discolor TaxID=1912936 RepID=A0A9P7JMM2_9AGAM|nr:uncharacterized protein F5147DRAFT_724069 [Suillus discolor]KAG2091003.1 hypothetical protein F5147DRAFT_724069 [Suillus discolor]